MDQSTQYGQMDFNLPHDVVKLPSKGIFYKPKKESLKVGYLTANDENLLMSPNVFKDGLIYNLLRNKIYEPGFDINQLMDVDVQAILIFLRNTSFGSEYTLELVDPSNNQKFSISYNFDSVSYLEPKVKPDENGLFSFTTPVTKKSLKLKILNVGDQRELEKVQEQYPKGMIAPIVTKKLEKHIVELDGRTDKQEISKFVTNLPIKDSKEIQKFIVDCEPSLDLNRTVVAPSGEEVGFRLTFGVDFFRPFFGI
jgi:hypothetical protein